MGKSYNRKVISIYTEFTAFMRRIKIFISSVQSEFSKERAMLCHYIRTDVLLGKFFEPFIFEEVPANEYPISHVYLNEVKLCDIYLGLYGNLYGYEDAEGVSPDVYKRQGYWKATEEQLKEISGLHVRFISEHGPACSGFVCDNQKLQKFVISHIPENGREVYQEQLDRTREVQTD